MQQLPKIAVLCTALFLTATTGFAQSGSSPAADALRQFNAYKPVIERTQKARVDEPHPITGDINGDGLADCIVFFVLTPLTGGNAIIGRQAAVYLNTGKGVKVAGQFPELDFCYSVNKIVSGVIYLDDYRCAPPYNEQIGTRKYRWQSGKLIAVR